MSDAQDGLVVLLGQDAPNLSPSVIGRPTAEWQTEYDRWQKPDPSARRCVAIGLTGFTWRAEIHPRSNQDIVVVR